MKKIIITFILVLSVLLGKAQKNNDANRLMIISGGKVGYIDTAGNTVLPASFSMGGQFSEGVASVVHSGGNGFRFTFINDKMDIVIPTVFDAAGDFSEGLARVQVNNKWGYIDIKGNTVIEPAYQLCYEFIGGYAQAQSKGKWGMIDKKGKWIIQPTYQDITQMGEGLLAVQQKMGGYFKFIDINGMTAFKDSFERAGFFTDGLAPVRKEGKWGFINKKGELVIDYRFTGAREFSEGLACVEKDHNNWGFINTAGEIVISFEFDRSSRFRYNHAYVEHLGKQAYINKKGEFVWKSIE